MSNVNITRFDGNLDSKRIEKILSSITDRISDIKYDRKDVLSERKKELKKQVIAQNNLEPHYAAIQGINDEVKKLEDQIRKLKNEKEPHQIAIAKVMRGSESTYDYDRVQEGSPADDYMQQHLPNVKEIKENLSKLDDEIEEKLWLAKDIDEARELHAYALKQIEEISKGL
jgi:hypothetical protein